MPYVNLDENGKVIGVAARPQPGWANEAKGPGDPAYDAFQQAKSAKRKRMIIMDELEGLDREINRCQEDLLKSLAWSPHERVTRIIARKETLRVELRKTA